MTLEVSERFDVDQMVQFMSSPDVYWALHDALAPPPEMVDFREHMALPTIRTLACTFGGIVFGFVQFVRRTSVCAEVTCAFHPQFRGKTAKVLGEYAIARAFQEYGLAKLICAIPSDNRVAIMAARVMGFSLEGRFTKAIVRQSHGLTDILLFGLRKDQWYGQHTIRSSAEGNV